MGLFEVSTAVVRDAGVVKAWLGAGVVVFVKFTNTDSKLPTLRTRKVLWVIPNMPPNGYPLPLSRKYATLAYICATLYLGVIIVFCTNETETEAEAKSKKNQNVNGNKTETKIEIEI